MQTFSIAAGEYEGFSFRVNPVDSSIVEFTYPGGAGDDQHTNIAQFKRNGSLVSVTAVPVARAHEVIRNASTGQPALPDPKPTAEQVEAVKERNLDIARDTKAADTAHAENERITDSDIMGSRTAAPSDQRPYQP